MPSNLVLLTGGTGHVGFATLVQALRNGYQVRASVRREAAIEQIKRVKSIQPYLSQLSFVVIPDITKEGAFDEAVKGVDFIIHVASPLASDSVDYEQSHIIPAVKGTTCILYSALKEHTIKKVVLTASVAAIRPRDDRNKSFTADNTVSDIKGPFANSFAAYGASKVRAHNTVLKFIAEEKPSYEIINIMPVFVLGPNELVKTREGASHGSNRVALGPILGHVNPACISPSSVHVDDVAFLYIAALDLSVKGHQNFGAKWPRDFEWDNIVDIVKRRFPKKVADGTLPLGGRNGTSPELFDVSRTETVFNIKFKDLETQVVDLVEWYLRLPKEVTA